ncbi:23S rRNA (adenine(1618)-N(6))-methyltransferase RlmF [Kaistella palustris]|uniref:23S rRNA (adenine(1618)-N(6))-methyltransferase RlmF n=1 Tax=Kaistella palustris TaxID=493376 RepID=UPI000414F2D8|nr:23S rRNA (adenine(1618)-N(6))-methyltransferase RlmF [Kaistella palustris]
MPTEKNSPEKTRLHPRNKNRENYDLEALKTVEPQLQTYIKTNKYGSDSVDFAEPRAVKLLNKALLNYYYGIKNWDFPDSNLCPPIPGRADYLHYMADLLTQSNFGVLPMGNRITALDIGVGASCIYPLIGVAEYGWNFIGSDVDAESINSASQIITLNDSLSGKIDLRLQKNGELIFENIIGDQETIDLTFCNPPFHSTAEEAEKGSRRKVRNLSRKKVQKPVLNFSGVSAELVYEGGESAFIIKMINESAHFAKNCFWFSTLVSKQSTLKGIYKALEHQEITEIKTIAMGTGNKSSRIVAWSYLAKEEQNEWRQSRWRGTARAR